MNRAQRRAQQRVERQQKKRQPAYMKLSKDARIDALIKNGITPDDLKKSFDEGYEAGFSDAAPSTFKTIYAAICLALNEMYSFDAVHCMKTLKCVDRIVIEQLTSAEAIQAVYDKMGLELDFNDPLDVVRLNWEG